jgi:hypothetical protein
MKKEKCTMWKNSYKDYKPNEKFIQSKIETGKGIIGCEMNESYGWGQKHESTKERKRSLFRQLLRLLLTGDY